MEKIYSNKAFDHLFFVLFFIFNFFCSIIHLSIQLSGPLLNEAQVRSIVDEIKHVITASSTRITERAERTKTEDFDTEEGEFLKEENEQEEEIFDRVCHSCHTSFNYMFDRWWSFLCHLVSN